jgi:F-type H+-transporting ATPase subunit b
VKPVFPLSGLWRSLGISAAFLFLTVAPAFAQESQPSAENSPMGEFFHWLNFVIVVVAIGYLFWKAAPAFRSHAEEISQKIAEGTRAREAAEKQRRDVEAKLAGIDQEVAVMRAEAKRGTEAEVARLRVLARQEAEIIERAAQAEIAAAQRSAHLELKALAARLAIERAEALLRSEMSAEAEAGLFRTFVEELQGSAN